MQFHDSKAGLPILYWKDSSSIYHSSSAIRTYPSGEPLIDAPREARPYAIMVKPRSVMELMGALWFADAVMERLSRPLELVLPFVPGSRQDRLNDRGDYLFTAKSVAREINLRKFRSVTILDPHSEVTPALISRCKVVHAADCWAHGPKYVGVYQGVISPDAGAEKRAAGVAKAMGVQLIHAWKTRNVANGEISGFGCEPLCHPGRFLVVDDICDGGGTFVGLAQYIDEHNTGVTLDLYVTHGIFSQQTVRLSRLYEGLYDRIITTDSLDGARPPGVEIIPVCKKLFEEI